MSGKWKSIIALPAALGHKDHPVLSVRNDRFAAGISAPPVPGFGRQLPAKPRGPSHARDLVATHPAVVSALRRDSTSTDVG